MQCQFRGVDHAIANVRTVSGSGVGSAADHNAKVKAAGAIWTQMCAMKAPVSCELNHSVPCVPIDHVSIMPSGSGM